MDLTSQQLEAISLATNSIENENSVFKLGGYAGTGKTTVSRYVIDSLDSLTSLPCAFTGKAALRLREKGIINSRTIHSLIYDYDSDEKRFCLKNYLQGDYFLIDEASMLNYLLWKDILTFNKPILLVGDPGQLQPVGKDPKLMQSPDFILSQIHRQAEDNGIIQFASDIRNNKPIKKSYDNVLFKRYYGGDDLQEADIVICGYNTTRCEINNRIRELKDYKGILNKGEQIMILKNNSYLGIFNGQLLTVEEILAEEKDIISTVCKDLEDEVLYLELDKSQFGKLKSDEKEMGLSSRAYADYGYCITCHKSQGSEWNNALVIDQQYPKFWDEKRWRYTAITRASKNLSYIINENV